MIAGILWVSRKTLMDRIFNTHLPRDWQTVSSGSCMFLSWLFHKMLVSTRQEKFWGDRSNIFIKLLVAGKKNLHSEAWILMLKTCDSPLLVSQTHTTPFKMNSFECVNQQRFKCNSSVNTIYYCKLSEAHDVVITPTDHSGSGKPCIYTDTICWISAHCHTNQLENSSGGGVRYRILFCCFMHKHNLVGKCFILLNQLWSVKQNRI